MLLAPQADNVTSEGGWLQDARLCDLAAGWGSSQLETHVAKTAIDGSVSSKIAVASYGGTRDV